MKVYVLFEQVSPRKIATRAVVDNPQVASDICALQGQSWTFQEFDVGSYATAQEWVADEVRRQTVSKLSPEEIESLRAYFSST